MIFDENFIPKSTGFVLEMKVVYCLESKNASATQNPARGLEVGAESTATVRLPQVSIKPVTEGEIEPTAPAILPEVVAKQRHSRIHYSGMGFSYETICKDYLPEAEEITVEDPYIRAQHQIVNFLRF